MRHSRDEALHCSMCTTSCTLASGENVLQTFSNNQCHLAANRIIESFMRDNNSQISKFVKEERENFILMKFIIKLVGDILTY